MTNITNHALAEHADAIRRISKQTMENIVEIGRRLTECRAILKKNGEWCAWLEDEFDWSDQTARRFIHVYEQHPGLNKLLSWNFPVSALYLLAAPSTPVEARTKIIERAQAGEPVSVAEIKRTIDAAKSRSRPARKPTPAQAAKGQDRNDIGPASTGEVGRLQARVEELENENYRLKRSNIALRDEIGGGKSGLAEKLEPLLETLFEQHTRNMATVSLMAVAVAVSKLERLLVDYGIMPASRRTEDPQGYARLLKDRAQREARQRDRDRYGPAAEAKPNSDSPPPPPDDDIPGFLDRTRAAAP